MKITISQLKQLVKEGLTKAQRMQRGEEIARRQAEYKEKERLEKEKADQHLSPFHTEKVVYLVAHNEDYEGVALDDETVKVFTTEQRAKDYVAALEVFDQEAQTHRGQYGSNYQIFPLHVGR